MNEKETTDTEELFPIDASLPDKMVLNNSKIQLYLFILGNLAFIVLGTPLILYGHAYIGIAFVAFGGYFIYKPITSLLSPSPALVISMDGLSWD